MNCKKSVGLVLLALFPLAAIANGPRTEKSVSCSSVKVYIDLDQVETTTDSGEKILETVSASLIVDGEETRLNAESNSSIVTEVLKADDAVIGSRVLLQIDSDDAKSDKVELILYDKRSYKYLFAPALLVYKEDQSDTGFRPVYRNEVLTCNAVSQTYE